MTPAVLAAVVVARGQSLAPVVLVAADNLRLVADTLQAVRSPGYIRLAVVAGSLPVGRSLGLGLVGFGL